MRFTNELVDEALYNDFRLMNGLQPAQLDEFIGLVLRFLAGQTAAEFMDAVSAFAAAHSASPNALKNPLRGALLISFLFLSLPSLFRKVGGLFFP